MSDFSKPIDPKQFLSVIAPALERGDAHELSRSVLARWRPREVCQLLNATDADVRKSAALILGMVGDTRVIGCLIRALHDDDEQVNTMAEHGLWSIWFRQGNEEAACWFSKGLTLLGEEQHADAARAFDKAIIADETFAEAYNQCAIARFFLADYPASLDLAREAVAYMPPHFGAIAGMGHCYTQLGQLECARHCYSKALSINPRMGEIRQMIQNIDRRVSANQSTGEFFANEIAR